MIHPRCGVRFAVLFLSTVLILTDSSHSTPLSPGEKAENGNPDFKVVRIAGPFEYPWSIGFLPDGGMLVTERPGHLRYVEAGSGEITDIDELPEVVTGEQAGLMDVAVDPDFARNRTIYLSYAHGADDLSTVRVLKASLDLNEKKLTDRQVIFEAQPYAVELINYGGRLALDADGFLFLTLGDRYEKERSQDLSDDWGSVIRIRKDGSIPQDNPFVGKPGARPGIWSYGHRNPQGLAIDAQSGQMWVHEHGPMGGDELNLVQRGHNYGWPVITYGKDYDGTTISDLTEAPGMEQPAYYWVPSIATSGLAVYRSGRVPQWRNTIWLGGLVGEVLVRLSLSDTEITKEERFLKEKLGRIRDVRLGPDGFIYLLTDDPEGDLYRIEPLPLSASRASSSH